MAFRTWIEGQIDRLPHFLLHRRDSATWEGVIVGREWAADMPEEELLLMRLGSRARMEHPDAVTAWGAPIYQLSEFERKQARRLLDRECLGAVETHNIVTNLGRTNILNFLATATGYTGIQYFAVGSNNGTPASSDTALFSNGEFFRKAFTLTTITTNQLDVTTNFASNEGNGVYGDCGIFGSAPGSTASTTANSGILYAHASYGGYTKAVNTTLTNDYYVNLQ